MRWEGQRESGNIEDRRGLTPARGAGIGLGGIVLVLAVSFMTGANPLQILNMLSGLQEASGPLVNARGEVIGISSDVVGRRTVQRDTALAVPIERALDVARHLRAYGEVRRGAGMRS